MSQAVNSNLWLCIDPIPDVPLIVSDSLHTDATERHGLF